MRGPIAILVILVAGWMVFDGSHALLTGDYVTPSGDPYSGQFGAWQSVVEAVGIPARSTGMKRILVTYGVAYLLCLVLYLRGARVWVLMVMFAILGLWYLPFGTAANVLVLIFLMIARRRRSRLDALR